MKNERKIMSLKRILVAALASGLAMWLLAGIWHTIIAVSFYQAETEAEHEGLGIILISYLILGLLMAWVYRYYARVNRTILQSLIFGGIMGLLWVFPHELAMAGAHGEPLPYVFKNALWHLVEQGVGGMVLNFFAFRDS